MTSGTLAASQETQTSPATLAARGKVSLLRGTVWAARVIRHAPLGLVLLTIGLSFPVGLRMGPVNVSLADLAIGWLTIQWAANVALGNRRLAVPLILGWTLFMVGAAGSVVALLVWVNFSSQLALFGAEFTYVWTYTHGSRAGRRDRPGV